MSQSSYRLHRFFRCMVAVLSAVLAWADDINFTVNSALFAQPEAERKQQIEARLAPTALAWPGGHLTAGEAVALLAASGNPTLLVDPQDAARVADLPALSGNYWQGVVAVCTAFDLAIELSEGRAQTEDDQDGNSDHNGTAIMATGGPVMLRSQAAGTIRPLYIPSGPVLTEVVGFDLYQRQGAVTNRTADIRLTFRLEPRILSTQVGTTLVSWKSAEDQSGRRLKWTDIAGGTRGDVNTITLSEVQERFAGCTLSGQLMIQILESVSLNATVKLGDKAHTELLGQEVSLRLLKDGMPDGQRGPGFVLSAPTAVLGTRPKLSVTVGGQPLRFNNQGASGNGDRMEFYYRGPKKLDGVYAVTLTSQAPLQQVIVPIRLPITPEKLPRTEHPFPAGLDLQIPTHLHWEAGECAVAEAVKRLGTTNQVLLEFGVDERRRATLPAFEGNFWDGVLVICRAFELAILPSTQVAQSTDANGQNIPSCITGGPLCLGKRQGDRPGIEAYQASGILLMGLDALTVVTKQGLSGVTRHAELRYRLRLEPRLDPSLIGSAVMSWTSLAVSRDGRPLVVEAPMAPGTEGQQTSQFGHMQQVQMQQQMQFAIRMMQGAPGNMRISTDGVVGDAGGTPVSGHVTVSGLPSESTPLHLSGQVSIQLFRPARAELSLTVGGRTVAKMGDRSVAIKMFSAADDDLGGNMRSGVSVETVGGELDNMSVEVRDAGGKQLRHAGNGGTLWYFAGLDKGPYDVVLTAREPLGTLRLPLTLNAKTP
jgi:hypothetical protein